MRKYLSITVVALMALLAFSAFSVAAQGGTPEAPEATEPAPIGTEPAVDLEATEAAEDTGPMILVNNQLVAHGDNWPGAVTTLATEAAPGVMATETVEIAATETADMATGPTLLVDSVVAEVPGFVVVSQNVSGTPGTVIGFAPVDAGTTNNLEVILNPDPGLVTPILWVVLHEDTGTIGEYDLTGVDDQPVSVNEVPVAVAIQAAPSIVATDQTDGSGVITVRSAMIDAPGWLVVHADDNGAPGAVLGQAALADGVNLGVTVTIDPAAATDSVWLMLHYDTGTAGTYEFGTVEGADVPVLLAGSPVMTPISLVAVQPVGTQDAALADVCSVVTAGNAVNRRSGPGTEYGVLGTFVVGEAPVVVTGFAADTTGQQWWQLEDGSWVRGDVVIASGPCDNVPLVQSVPAAPVPAATESILEPMATEAAQ